MRLNLLFTLFIIMAALTFLWVSDRVEALDVTAIMSGSIAQINPHSIIVVDYRNGKKTQFQIEADTVYNNVRNLMDLKTGDLVQIDYKIIHHQNTAITITKTEIESAERL